MAGDLVCFYDWVGLFECFVGLLVVKLEWNCWVFMVVEVVLLGVYF